MSNWFYLVPAAGGLLAIARIILMVWDSRQGEKEHKSDADVPNRPEKAELPR